MIRGITNLTKIPILKVNEIKKNFFFFGIPNPVTRYLRLCTVHHESQRT